MTTTRTYLSTDPGAPVLTGAVGSLTSLLKTLLVGTAGVAYGTGPTQKLAAGWTNAYENIGLNKVALRNSIAAGGTGCYLRIDDNGSFTGGAREAGVRLYKTMSDVDTGTEATPDPAVAVNGVFWRKSNAVSATAVRWKVVADERTVIINVECLPIVGSGTGYPHMYYAGDYNSDNAAQPAACALSGFQVSSTDTNGSASTSGFNNIYSFSTAHTNISSNTLLSGNQYSDLWLMRGVTGVAGPVRAGALLMNFGVQGQNNSIWSGYSQTFLRNPSDGAGNLYFTPAFIAAPSNGAAIAPNYFFGELRGVRWALNNIWNDGFFKTYVGGPGSGFTNILLFLENRAGGSSTMPNNSGSCVGVETGEAW